MTFNRARFTDAVAQSGLSMRELGALYGVTRPTLYDWLAAGHPKHFTLDQWVGVVTEAILRAVERRLLPFPKSLLRPARNERIGKMRAALLETKKLYAR